MKKTKLFYSLIILILTSISLKSQQTHRTKVFEKEALQNWECGADVLMKAALAEDPGLEDRLNQFNNSGSKFNNNLNVNAAPPPVSNFIIPVVFHVISDPNNPTMVPTYAQIQMQLASLNAAFSNNLVSLNNVPQGSRAVHAKIQFCFAKLIQPGSTAWPNGTPGMMTYLSTNQLMTNININSNASKSTLAALTNASFPPSMYLNIWCVPNITTVNGANVNAVPSVIGFGTFPWLGGVIDGIVMRNDCIGNNTYNNFTGNMFPPLDKGNILAHEAGHYLGLFHTFETLSGGPSLASAGGAPGCYGTGGASNPTLNGDLIFDTPPTMLNGNVLPGIYNTCNETYAPYSGSANENDQIENFMSYIDDDYMNTFTQNQSERMWGALGATWSTTFLNGQRTNLVSAGNLNATGVNNFPSCGPGLLNSNFTNSLIVSSITCNSVAYKFFQPVLPGYLSATNRTWFFGDGSTSNAINPVHTYFTPPTVFPVTVTLVVSNGASTSTSTMQISAPTGTPQIVGFSGKNNPVCRGTEQTILIKFPPFLTTAILTDGTNFFNVNTNFRYSTLPPFQANNYYTFPYTFTITNSATYSLVLGGCGGGTPSVASFTVVDCCNNLVNNGNFEAGPVGFTSQYTLNATLTDNGWGAVNFPALTNYPGMANQTNLTGKMLCIDSFSPYACGAVGTSSLIVGQNLTGLSPSTNYYIAMKVSQSADSFPCSNKFKMKMAWSGGTVLDKNVRPATFMQINVIPGGTGLGSQQVFNFMITTPNNITPATVFTLQIFEIENKDGQGFDYTFDNIIVARMNGGISLSPTSSSICTGGSVQLNAVSNCSNIANYTLQWQPALGLSCNNCANPIASPAVTTVYTLIAIPPITVPPSANIVLTSTVTVIPSAVLSIAVSTLANCSPALYSLCASGVPTATWQPMNTVGLCTSVSPLVPTTYTASYLNTVTGCISFSTVTINPPLPVSLAVGGNSVYCPNAGPAVVSATPFPIGSIATYTWLPGNLSGATQSLTPAVSTIYTVMATINGCPASATFAVQQTTNCCSQSTVGLIPLPTTTNGIIPPGSYFIENNITLTANTTFSSSEYLIMPNVKIIVKPGVNLILDESHLYACGILMWQGIEVQDGGRVSSSVRKLTSMIEDAEVGIDVDGISMSNSSPNPPIDINLVVFNKNRIGIKLSNSDPNLNTLPIGITECVFASKTMSFTAFPNPLSWPSADNTASGLRFAAVGATTGLAPPYPLLGFAQCNSIKTYTGQPGHIGIKIETVGSLSGVMPSAGVSFGNAFAGNANMFNLFDGLGKGIEVTDASLTTPNNVFQNIQRYQVSPGNWFGGKGIEHSVTGLMNARLNLSPPVGSQTTDYGNRFWNCWDAVKTNKVFEVDVEYSILRSTHNVFSGYAPGAVGIILESNRFEYNIQHNEFNNIAYSVWLNTNNGPYNIANNAGAGTYAGNIEINQNYFGPQVTSTTGLSFNPEYSHDAITLYGVNGSNWQMAGSCKILSNKLDRVYRGIRINKMEDYPIEVGGNNVLISDDNFIAPGSEQYGVYVNDGLGNLIIRENILAGSGTANPTITLVHCINNIGVGSPYVGCNILSNSNYGFNFEGQNGGTIWEGNYMTNHWAGLVLSNNGVIGPQGAPGSASSNTWLGPWFGPTWETYCIASNASASPLFVSVAPTANGGGFSPYGPADLPYAPTNPAVVDCAFNNIYAPVPSQKNMNPVGVKSDTGENFGRGWLVQVFPNPSKGFISVTSNVQNETLLVRILDVTGKLVYYTNVNSNNNTIDVTSLSASIYIIEIQNRDNRIVHKKLVIE